MIEKIEGVKQPEYTGENRCIPCTIVNVLIALVLAGLAYVISLGVSVVVLVLSLIAIYVRGYLVPGTPTLTKQYMPERILALFDKGPVIETRDTMELVEDSDEATDGTGDGTSSGEGGDGTSSGEGGDDSSGSGSSFDPEEFETVQKIEHQREHAVNPEEFMVEVGAVEPCEDEDDLCLNEEFAAAIESNAERYREIEIGTEEVATLFDADFSDVTDKEREYPAFKVGRWIRKWPDDGALVVDLATHDALVELTDRWLDVPEEQRIRILKSLRAFHVLCPLCAGPIDLSSETFESCCQSAEVYALHCEDCEALLVEFTGEELGIEP